MCICGEDKAHMTPMHTRYPHMHARRAQAHGRTIAERERERERGGGEKERVCLCHVASSPVLKNC
jgi:hypothetical protein